MHLQTLAQACSDQWRTPAPIHHHRLRNGGDRKKPLHQSGEVPLSLHLFQWLEKVPGGPYFFGTPNYHNPLRMFNIIQIYNRQPPTRGRNWLLEKKDWRRAICASVSQKGCSSVSLLAEAESRSERMINGSFSIRRVWVSTIWSPA